MPLLSIQTLKVLFFFKFQISKVPVLSVELLSTVQAIILSGGAKLDKSYEAPGQLLTLHIPRSTIHAGRTSLVGKNNKTPPRNRATTAPKTIENA